MEEEEESTQVDSHEAPPSAPPQPLGALEVWGILIPVPPLKTDPIQLRAPTINLGKGADNDVRFDDPRISAKHCKFWRVPETGSVYLLDLSRNGTHVNRASIKKEDAKELHSGDEISLLKPLAQGQADGENKDVLASGVVPRAPFYPFLFQKCAEARPHPPLLHAPRPLHLQQTIHATSGTAELLRGTSLCAPDPHTKSFGGEYELINELGRGSFAVVKKVRHRKTGVHYALKSIDKKRLLRGAGGQLHAEHKDKVLSEARILKSMSHPGIIKFHDIFETDDELCLVMELVEGGELFDYLCAHGPFKEDDARCIMDQLLQALHYLHSKHIVHRDLKPENILLRQQQRAADGTTPPPRIKIADFGLAKLVGAHKVTSTFCGTPQYFAPEVLESRNSHRGYDAACDLWSAGVLLYILLSGSPPFIEQEQPGRGLSIYDQIKQGISSTHFERSAWKDVSASAKQFVRELLVVDPRRRMSGERALQHPWMKGEAIDDAGPTRGMLADLHGADDIEEFDTDGEEPLAFTANAGRSSKSKRQRTTMQQPLARCVVPLQTNGQTNSRHIDPQLQSLQPPPPTQAAFKAPITLKQPVVSQPHRGRVGVSGSSANVPRLSFQAGGS